LKSKEDNSLDILILGNIKDQKNQHFLVPLAQGLITKGYKVCFHICGKIQDAQYHQALLQRIEKNNLLQNFRFYHQFNNFNEIPLSVDIALMVSKDESGPLVNIEYLLLKVPFLTHDVGDVSMIIKKYLPAQVIANLDASAWVDNILELYTHGAAIDKYETIYQKYFPNNIAYHNWLETYQILQK
jgi:glycosyltransferase involved in cell wall biosynthesis